MVIWLFAGGGESEIRGMVPFLEKHFPGCIFVRKTPVQRRPGPRPNVKPPPGYGKTGQSLAREIKERLPMSLMHKESCDSILVIDDLDCHDVDIQRRIFSDVIESVAGVEKIDKFIGFAAPELESWIIADWDNSIARHPDFRGRHFGMRHWLSATKKIPFDQPESFSVFDPEKDACKDKMSEAIIESSIRSEHDRSRRRYSKGFHTPSLLLDIDPRQVKKKCPLFRELHHFLNKACEKP